VPGASSATSSSARRTSGRLNWLHGPGSRCRYGRNAIRCWHWRDRRLTPSRCRSSRTWHPRACSTDAAMAGPRCWSPRGWWAKHWRRPIRNRGTSLDAIVEIGEQVAQRFPSYGTAGLATS
jgi:hypothetical protein